MDPAWFQIAAGLALVIGGALSLDRSSSDDEDDGEPWGFNVTDGGVVDGGFMDGGESEWEDE